MLLIPFSNAQEISQGYTNEHLVMLFFATVFTIYVAAKNPPDVIGYEKIIQYTVIKNPLESVMRIVAQLCSKEVKKNLYLLCRLLGGRKSNFFSLLEKNDLFLKSYTG